MITDRILAAADQVLGSITPSHLRRYDFLQRTLMHVDVVNCRDFQRTFVGFYQMRFAKPAWKSIYFAMLEQLKHSSSCTLESILRELFDRTGGVELSFSSKMLATIHPHMPVYDSKVRGNLALEEPPKHGDKEARIRRCIEIYAKLDEKVRAIIRTEQFLTLRRLFDQRHAEYAHLHEVKKLDLMMWQYRPRGTAGGGQVL